MHIAYTVEPLHEGHIGTEERGPLFRGEQCISTIRKSILGTFKGVLCREGFSILSLNRISTVYIRMYVHCTYPTHKYSMMQGTYVCMYVRNSALIYLVYNM